MNSDFIALFLVQEQRLPKAVRIRGLICKQFAVAKIVIKMRNAEMSRSVKDNGGSGFIGNAAIAGFITHLLMQDPKFRNQVAAWEVLLICNLCMSLFTWFKFGIQRAGSYPIAVCIYIFLPKTSQISIHLELLICTLLCGCFHSLIRAESLCARSNWNIHFLFANNSDRSPVFTHQLQRSLVALCICILNLSQFSRSGICGN